MAASNASNVTNVSVEDFTPADDHIKRIVLTNTRGVKVVVTNFGATLVSVHTPDRHGNTTDILLGFDSLAEYKEKNAPHFGGTIGRFANRVAHGRFSLDGVEYRLAQNCGEHHLHGGACGFDAQTWQWSRHGDDGVRFTLVSADGDEGYPGTVTVETTYRLTEANELHMNYRATADAPTIINLTNHVYVNLCGGGSSVLQHTLQIDSDTYLPHAEGIPTELRPVDATFDFRTARPIGERIGDTPDGIGYDHTYCLREGNAFCAKLHEATSGRCLEVHTSQPGVQLYTANYLEGVVGKGGAVYGRHGAVCLEPQNYPDAINQALSPRTCVLREGEVYEEFIKWVFSIE